MMLDGFRDEAAGAGAGGGDATEGEASDGALSRVEPTPNPAPLAVRGCGPPQSGFRHPRGARRTCRPESCTAACAEGAIDRHECSTTRVDLARDAAARCSRPARTAQQDAEDAPEPTPSPAIPAVRGFGPPQTGSGHPSPGAHRMGGPESCTAARAPAAGARQSKRGHSPSRPQSVTCEPNPAPSSDAPRPSPGHQDSQMYLTTHMRGSAATAASTCHVCCAGDVWPFAAHRKP